MIRLKSGKIVEYDQDFDVFFRRIVKEIIDESAAAANITKTNDRTAEFEKELIKEMMDNSIYVTHQIFDLYKENPNTAKFMMTGFIFNSVVLNLPQSNPAENAQGFDTGGSSTMH